MGNLLLFLDIIVINISNEHLTHTLLLTLLILMISMIVHQSNDKRDKTPHNYANE